VTRQHVRPREAPGAERLVLALALIVPLAVVVFGLSQLIGLTVNPTRMALAEPEPTAVLARRPAASNAAPPPTLAPPTATPRPTAAPASSAQNAQPGADGQIYTVQKGDELRNIAAQYGVSIGKIIAANDIPNPDSLRVGQVLKIPGD
jgi:nucleoid-associated protein YgaU